VNTPRSALIKNSVLVTDGYWRKSLAAVRALSGAGLKVGIGERTVFAPALFSRHAHWKYVYPSAVTRPVEFIQWLKETVKKGRFDALIVPEEETALLIAQHKEILCKFIRIAVPDYNTMNFARDKFRLLSHAASVDIPCPVTRLVSSPEDICGCVADMRHPLVLKPVTGTGAHGIHYIHSQKELKFRSKSAFERYGNFLIQEYIPGDEYYGVSLLFNEHNQMRAAFVHQKLRQYPVTGGVSTYAASVKYPRLVTLAEELLKSIGWYGVANVEFKIDKRDNTPRLMEVNPRLWGSLQLAIASGINFPYLLYKLTLEGDVKPVFEYRVGVKFRWLLQGDLMNFLSNLFRYRHIDPAFFRLYEKDTCHAIGSLFDPLPILGKGLSLIDFLTSKEMKKFRA